MLKPRLQIYKENITNLDKLDKSLILKVNTKPFFLIKLTLVLSNVENFISGDLFLGYKSKNNIKLNINSSVVSLRKSNFYYFLDIVFVKNKNNIIKTEKIIFKTLDTLLISNTNIAYRYINSINEIKLEVGE